VPDLYFEDFEPGRVYDLGSKVVSEDEIVAFARQFDPQPFHLDAEAAKDSVFGGLIASGWHTGAMWMRLYVDSLLGGESGQGSSGIEELRWLAPVRPGDTLSGRLIVLEATLSESHPERGTIRIRGEMVNQDGVTVMSMVSRGRFARRGPQ
jgi:acyl dehydratase